MSDQEIYLDYAATSPVDPAVTAAMLECLQHEFGNPSSQHAAGRRARRLVEAARAAVAARVGAEPECLLFTSGATEANNLALQGVLRRQRSARPHLVTSRIEHKSVLDAARALEAEGVEVTYVEAEADGSVDPRRVAAAIRADTALVSIMHVNNETGVIQDVNAIGALCRERGVSFHVDAAQSAGKLPLELAGAPIDLCSLTAHKVCGPKGVGALYVAPHTVLAAQVHAASRSVACAPERRPRTRSSAWAGRTSSRIHTSRRRGLLRCATGYGTSSSQFPGCARTVRPRGARLTC